MKRALIPVSFLVILIILGAYLITSEYGKAKRNTATETTKEESVKEEIVSLDELSGTDTVVLVEKNPSDRLLKVRHISGGDDYEVTYEDNLQFYNKYGTVITLGELQNGEILDIIYSKHNGNLTSVKVSSQTWTLSEMTDYSIQEKRKRMDIMGEAYQLTDDTVYFSQDEEIKPMDITDMDTLTIKGYNRKVCSVIVEKGHGYLRVKNDSYFVGGYIEVGQKIIKPLTEEMLLPVSEGSYDVRVTNKGYVGEEKVVINRDKETILDLSDIEIEEVAVGHIQFDLSPVYAQLYVDGELAEYEDRVPLEYGVHRIRVEAAGYKTIETSIKVGNDYANVEISLDEDKDAEKVENKTPEGAMENPDSSDSADTSTNVTSDTSIAAGTENETAGATETTISENKKIYVESPSGTEVYLDGNYIGVAPVNTNKVTGSHTITLSKQGYQTKSYNIYIENDGNDVTLSFSELLEGND